MENVLYISVHPTISTTHYITVLFLFQEKCTHPEDVKLCTVIVKTNGSMPAKNKRTVCELVYLLFFLHVYGH